MVLTRHKRPRPLRDPDKFPVHQLAILAFVRLAEPIAITSILPYAWKFVLDFHVGDPASASFWAGILIASFNLAEAISGVLWGGISDRLGRKPVLILGLLGTTLSLLLVGFALNFWVAMLARIFGGVLNGNVGVVQTMVGEIVINPAHEPKAYAVMPFVWSVGIIIGPAIGGYFAAPADSLPGTIFDNELFRRFPYALPNIICAAIMLVSVVNAYFLLEETHPDMSPYGTDSPRRESVTPLTATQGITQMSATNLQHEGYGTFNDVSEEAVDERWNVQADGTSKPASVSSVSEKWLTRRIVMLMIALGIFTYHSMTYDHLMPIFFQDRRVPKNSNLLTLLASPIASKYGSFAGGLGLTVKQCGIILAFNGVIALFVQAIVFPLVASWIGVWRTFILVTLLHPVAYFIVPWLALLPDQLLYLGIYTCLTVRNLTSILAYPVLLILIKEASPSNHCLGKINGLAASTGGIFRTLASPIAGLLYGIGDKIEFTALAWWTSAAVALIGSFQAFTVSQASNGPQHTVRAACKFVPDAERGRRQSNVVRIKVHEAQDSGYHSEDDNERTPFASRVPRA